MKNRLMIISVISAGILFANGVVFADSTVMTVENACPWKATKYYSDKNHLADCKDYCGLGCKWDYFEIKDDESPEGDSVGDEAFLHAPKRGVRKAWCECPGGTSGT